MAKGLKNHNEGLEIQYKLHSHQVLMRTLPTTPNSAGQECLRKSSELELAGEIALRTALKSPDWKQLSAGFSHLQN